MKLKTLAKLITNLIPSALLSFSLIYALTTSLNFKFSVFAIILFTAVPFILLPIIFMNKTSIKISAFLAALAIVGTAAYFLISKGWDIVYYYIQVFFIWIYNFMNDAQSYNSVNALICVIFISIVVSLCVYIFTVRRLRFPLLFISGVGLFAIQGIFNFFSSLTAFYIFCIMMIFYYMKHIHKKNSAVDKNEYAGQMGFLYSVLPLVILIGVLTFILPTSREPVHWRWLDKQYDAFMEMLDNPNSDPMIFDVFSLSSTGFGEHNNILGGKVKLNKTSVLKVESPRRLYLKGVIKNIYTGKAWLSTVESKLPLNDSNNTILDNDIEETMSDIIGINQAANIQSDEDVSVTVDDGKTFTSMSKKYITGTDKLKGDYSKYMNKDRVTVTFDNLIVRSIFLPLKANNIKFNEKNVRFDITKSGLVTTPTPVKKGFKYSFDVYTPKYNNEEVIKLLRKSKPGIIYEQYKAQIDSLSGMFGYPILTHNQTFTNYKLDVNVTDQTLLNYPEMFKITNQFEYLNNIYDLNLKVHESVPQRVKDLANRITSGCSNNYDKVKAIEKYLNDNYRYTLEPPDTPKNRDFVDYFLFDSKKGYCTYFASAMSILTRSLGIPARYVEGYMMPSKKNSQGNYIVTNEQAHAWVEVYFEGFGWVPFEATPAFYSSFYNKNSDSRLSDEMVKDPNYSEYVEYLKRLAMNRDNVNTDDLAVQDDNHNVVIIVLGIVLIAAVALFLFILSFNYFRRKLKLMKLLKMTPEEGAKGLYNYYLNILSIMGYPVEPGETPFDYSKRLYSKIDFLISSEVSYEDRLTNRGRIISELHKPKYDFARVTNLVVKAIYDKRGITAEERDVIFEYSHFLHESAKKYFGKNSYFVKVYILGKFKV